MQILNSPELGVFYIMKINKLPKVLPQSPPFFPLHPSFYSKPSPPKLPNALVDGGF